MATRPAYVWTGSDWDDIGDKRLGASVTALNTDLGSKADVLTALMAVGYVQSTSAFVTSSAHTTFQDDGLSVSCALVNGARYRVTVQCHFYAPGGVQTINLRVVAGPTEVGRFRIRNLSTGSVDSYTFTASFASGTTGAVTIKTQIVANDADTSVGNFGSSDFIRSISVDRAGS
jgi:hypothetical protein